MIDFVELLERWNRAYNLTAIREPMAMLTHHVVDCLAAVRPLRRELAERTETRLLDVGSGAGLPGIVLAIMEPAWEVTCIDSVGKKVAFLRQAASTLGLRNLRERHTRVEMLPNAGGYDVVTSRAFAALPDFTRLTTGVLAEGGLWMAMKGKIPSDEIKLLPRNVEMFHVEPLSVPGIDESRCLIWMRMRRAKAKSERTH